MSEVPETTAKSEDAAASLPDGNSAAGTDTTAEGESKPDRRRTHDDRYREQLRTVEQQRDQLQARVDAHDREAAERDVSAILVTAGDLWCGGISVDNCRDEDGNYSRDLAIEAARRVAKEHPNWAVATSPAAPAALVGWSASKPENQGNGQTFTDAFRPKGSVE